MNCNFYTYFQMDKLSAWFFRSTPFLLFFYPHSLQLWKVRKNDGTVGLADTYKRSFSQKGFQQFTLSILFWLKLKRSTIFSLFCNVFSCKPNFLLMLNVIKNDFVLSTTVYGCPWISLLCTNDVSFCPSRNLSPSLFPYPGFDLSLLTSRASLVRSHGVFEGHQLHGFYWMKGVSMTQRVLSGDGFVKLGCGKASYANWKLSLLSSPTPWMLL